VSPLPVVRPRPSGPRDLFIAFTVLALQGFGGVLAVTQRYLCDEKRWLTRAEFLETLSLGQLLPGPNVCNVALMVGDRFYGWRGAAAALGGMMLAPLVLVLVLTALYANFSSLPVVAGALKGMGAVAAGMIVGTALRLGSGLRTSPMGMPACVVLGLATFVLIAWLRLPLLMVLLGVGIPACVYAWWRIGRSKTPN
jgi:chromate transporter